MVSASGETGASPLLLLPLLLLPPARVEVAVKGAPHKRQKRASAEEKAPQLEQCFVIATFTKRPRKSLTNKATALFRITHNYRSRQPIMQRASLPVESSEKKSDAEND